ncbi:MAG: hypothetical protein U9Q40_03095 [Campylobacterota bacterium]|nr:hypothetical protein [Campylobacterota bacterium]
MSLQITKTDTYLLFDYGTNKKSYKYLSKIDSVGYKNDKVIIKYAGEGATDKSYLDSKYQANIVIDYEDITVPSSTDIGDLVSILNGYINDYLETLTSVGSNPTANCMIGTETGSIAYATDSTVNLTGEYPTINTDAQLVYLKVVASDGTTTYHTAGEDDIELSHSAGTVTISGATLDSADDSYELGINAPKYSKDYNGNSQYVKVLNPDPKHYTDPEQLVTASDIGASGGVYIEQGNEISMNTYTILGIFVKFTANNSTTNTIKVLSKHESGGAEEFVLETSGDYIKTLGDSNINIYYEFETNGTIPYLQIQSAAGVVDTGSGTIGTLEIYITKGRK